MNEPPSRYDITVTVERNGGTLPSPADFAVIAERAASSRNASVVSAHTAEQIISVVTVETSDRLAAAAVALAVVSEALGRPAVSPILKRTVLADLVRWLEQLPFPCAKLPTSSA